jgi:threonine/homoserine efflux transporter RhtA
MFLLRRLPACLALLMLGALSLRLGADLLVALPLTLLLLALAFVPGRLPATMVSLLLGCGALAWLAVGWLRLQQRLGEGRPWLRMVAIFCAVAVFTAWAAWLQRGPRSGPPTGDDAEGRG